jgi:hypothetical protein
MKYKNHILYLLCFLFAFPKLSLTAAEQADYIVIGVGTAGATNSKLLSDDPNTSVLFKSKALRTIWKGNKAIGIEIAANIARLLLQ